MVRNNREILTGGKKYIQKQQKKYGVDEVVFDKESRQEYLTGFHKRKVQRQKKAAEYIKEQERIARVEERKRIRDERKQDLENQLKQFNDSMHALQDVSDDDDDQWGGFDDTKQDDDEDDDTRDVKDDQPSGEEVINYHIDPETVQDSQAIIDDDTTVVIESVDNPLMTSIQELKDAAMANNVDLSKSKDVLDESIKRAQNYAITAGVKDKSKDRRKKKFRYLTKTERRDRVRKEKSSSFKKRPPPKK